MPKLSSFYRSLACLSQTKNFQEFVKLWLKQVRLSNVKGNPNSRYVHITVANVAEEDGLT